MNNKCKYQVTLKDFPYHCCNAQKYCPPVLCPHLFFECPVFPKEYNIYKKTQNKKKIKI